MPRTRPLPEREIEICKSLRRYRETIRFSRVAFAIEAGIDSSTLIACEHCRSPLRYGVAHQILTAFRINPEWLATGRGQTSIEIPTIPTPEELGVDPKALFSEVFDTRLGKLLAETIESHNAMARAQFGKLPFSVRLDSRGRLIAEMCLKQDVARWIQQIPDSHLNEFVNLLRSFGDDYLASRPRESSNTLEKRARELNHLRAALDARSEMLKRPRTERQISLTSPVSPVIEAPMPTWAQLKAKLQRLTATRGAQTALAEHCDVTRASISNWLKEDSTTEPGASAALLLLKWSETQQPTQNASGISSATGVKATRQDRRSTDESKSRKPKSGRTKK